VAHRSASAPDASALPRSGKKRSSRGRTERGLPGPGAVGTIDSRSEEVGTPPVGCAREMTGKRPCPVRR
jgi:hypothetical protein